MVSLLDVTTGRDFDHDKGGLVGFLGGNQWSSTQRHSFLLDHVHYLLPLLSVAHHYASHGRFSPGSVLEMESFVGLSTAESGCFSTSRVP